MRRDLTIDKYVVTISAKPKRLTSPKVVTGYTVRFAITLDDGQSLAGNVSTEVSEEITPKDHYFASVNSALDAG